jgi:flagellar biosynthetic protein FliO
VEFQLPYKIFISLILLYLVVNQKTFSASSPIAPSPSISLLQTILGLIVIIGLILLSAWVMRKISPSMGSNSLLKVISATSVGPREKVVIVEIEEQWLVVGVTSSQVNLLKKLPKGVLPSLGNVNNSSFVSKLKEVMKRNG